MLMVKKINTYRSIIRVLKYPFMISFTSNEFSFMSEY